MGDVVNIRPLESRDVAAFFPQGLRDTCVGWAVDLNGTLACVTGVSRGMGVMVAFSKIAPGVRASKRLIWETARELNRLVTSLPYDMIYALTKNGRFMLALGWTWVESRGEVEVFKWTR